MRDRATREPGVEEGGEALVEGRQAVDPNARQQRAHDPAVAKVDADMRAAAVDDEVAHAAATPAGQAAALEPAIERRRRAVSTIADACQLAGVPKGIRDEA
jgi:hypothetical protein